MTVPWACTSSWTSACGASASSRSTNAARPEGHPEFELYDHRAESLDQNDVAAANPEVVERLSKQLAAWRRKHALERTKRRRPDLLGPDLDIAP